MINDKKQQGIVSIVVTMILMVVLTLVVVSFAKISRNESRNALDRQLSTQAFYAAESGINVARSKLEATLSTDPGSALLKTSYMSQCSGPNSFANKAGITSYDVGPNSSFTCLFANPTPSSLVYSKTTDPIVFPFNPVDSSPDIKITWNKGGGGTIAGCTVKSSIPAGNPKNDPNCMAPLLRVEITKSPFGAADTRVFFVYPSGSVAYNFNFISDTTGIKGNANCSDANCSVIIGGVTPGSYVRLKGIYGPLAATIESSTGKNLTGAQAIIDATGKAADVERRLQVRVPISGLANNLPMYALEATDKICKHFALLGTADGVDPGTCWSGTEPD